MLILSNWLSENATCAAPTLPTLHAYNWLQLMTYLTTWSEPHGTECETDYWGCCWFVFKAALSSSRKRPGLQQSYNASAQFSCCRHVWRLLQDVLKGKHASAQSWQCQTKQQRLLHKTDLVTCYALDSCVPRHIYTDSLP